MLLINQLVGLGARLGRPLRVGNYGSGAGWTASASSRTLSSLDFGAAAEDRYVIAMIAARDDATNYTVSSCTIGGVSATILVDSAGAAGRSCAIAIARVPSGTTGQSIVVNWSEAVAFGQEIAWLVVYGLAGTAALSTGSQSGVETETVSITGQKARAGGLAVWSMFGFSGSAGLISWAVSPDLVDGSIVEITDQTAQGGAFGAAFALFKHSADDITLSGDQFHATPFHTMAVATFAPG